MRPAPYTSASVSGLLLLVALVACSGEGASPSAPAEPPSATARTSPAASEAPTVSPIPTASPSPPPTDEGTGPFAWTEAATLEAGDGLLLVSDVSAWSGGFLAIGHAWTEGFVEGAGEPRIWTSPDGRAWEEGTPDFGSEDMRLRGILRLSTGGVIVIGDAPGATQGPRARAFRSQDGVSWTEVDLPTEIAERGDVRVASGPVGHVVTLPDEIWYSADAESWQLAQEAPDGVAFAHPAAGDEGFVTWTSPTDGVGDPVVYASGDGLAWIEGQPPVPVTGVTPWRADWFGWGYTDDPPTISLLRSANGLDWSAAVDVADLGGPDGPTAGAGMDSDVTEVSLSGDGDVLIATLGWNHCCATPPRGVATHVTTDGESWLPAGLPDDAYITATATDGSVVVAAGHLDRGESIGFWVADR